MKQLYKFLILFLLIFNSAFLSSQNSEIKRTNHWYFGGGAGIDFSSGTAVADTNGQMAVYAGCATLSDTAGNLLMYTEGTTVWNKNHQIMPNGTGLLALGTPVQSSVIIPKPLDNNLYYIITNSSSSDGSYDGIRYSVVDMTLNGGLGDVTIKNELLFMPSSEQLGATMHANCTDVWIMGHETNSNKYRAYLLTASGIDTNSVVINDIGNYPKINNTIGYGLKFSPNGKKMAASNFWDNLNNTAYLDTLELFDFDNNTGLLSNLIQLPDSEIIAFNFSPDDKLLYVTNANTNTWVLPGFEEVFQYDISSNDAANIKASKTRIYYPLYYDFTDFQIGVDNSIYVANLSSDSISVIQYPNIVGSGCTIIENAVSLNGRTGYVSLPNFISSYFNQDITAGCFYTVGINEIHDDNFSITAYPNPFSTSTTIVINSPLERGKGCVIKLHDLLGKEITSSVIANEVKQSNETIITLNRNNLPAGIYFLNIALSSGVETRQYTQKLIITD